jgi:hypothetical protein
MKIVLLLMKAVATLQTNFTQKKVRFTPFTGHEGP